MGMQEVAQAVAQTTAAPSAAAAAEAPVVAVSLTSASMTANDIPSAVNSPSAVTAPAAPADAPKPTPAPDAGGGAGSAPALAGGEIAKGAKLFKGKCAQCHTTEPMGTSKQGPALHGVIGRKAGTIGGFAYSGALVDSKITWNDEQLSQFMINPKKYVPGTKMVFAGLKKENERNDIIAFIRDVCSK